MCGLNDKGRKRLSKTSTPTCQTPEFNDMQIIQRKISQHAPPQIFRADFPSFFLHFFQSYYLASLLQEGFACNFISCQRKHNKTKSLVALMQAVI